MSCFIVSNIPLSCETINKLKFFELFQLWQKSFLKVHNKTQPFSSCFIVSVVSKYMFHWLKLLKKFSAAIKSCVCSILLVDQNQQSPQLPAARYVLRAASCWHLAGSARDAFSNLIKTTMRKQ
jgi:hypothetical protein